MKKVVLLLCLVAVVALAGCAKKAPTCEVVNGTTIYDDTGTTPGSCADGVASFFSEYGGVIVDQALETILIFQDLPDISPSDLR